MFLHVLDNACSLTHGFEIGDFKAVLEVVLKVGAVLFHHYNIPGTLVYNYSLTFLSFLDTVLNHRNIDIPN